MVLIPLPLWIFCFSDMIGHGIDMIFNPCFDNAYLVRTPLSLVVDLSTMPFAVSFLSMDDSVLGFSPEMCRISL